MKQSRNITPLEDALAEFRRENGFEGAGRALWRIPIWRLRLDIPLTPGLARTLYLHDLHHVATGYATDLTGESEIAAWEVAGGCGPHVAEWIVDLASMVVGLALCPRKMFRAFVRGRRVLNLFRDHAALAPDASVGELRARLRPSRVSTGLWDAWCFGAWCAVAIMFVFGPPIALLWRVA